MKWISYQTLIWCLTFFVSGFSQVKTIETQQKSLWPDITAQTRPGLYWWWPGSAVDTTNISFNLEELHNAGFGGVTIVPIYGVKGYEDRFIPYLSEHWIDMLAYTLARAGSLGMWVDMTSGTGWPFGGPDVLLEDADMRVDLEGINIRTEFSGRKVKRAAPGGEGYALNPYSKTSLKKYLHKFDPMFQRLGTRLPRAQYHDSFEYSGNWSPEFISEFEKRRGYAIGPYLEMLSGDGDTSIVARVKSDYRETLAELHLEYIETWHEWAERNGCATRNQAHGAPGNLLDLYAASSIPETEIFGSTKFDIPGLRRDTLTIARDTPQPLINRMASSAAHISGKNLVAAETGTWVRNHFHTALSQIKPEIDQLFLCGVNHVFYHGNCYSPREAPWPGWLFYAAMQINPRNTLWNDLPVLNQYVTRCQAVLQSGKPDNDILLYWPVYDIWHDTTGMQRQLTVHRPEWLNESECGKIADSLVRNGYTFDYISDKFLNKISVIDTLVELSGNAYKVILLPHVTYLPVATLNRIIDLAEKGATVLIQNQLPDDVPGLNQFEARRKKKNLLLQKLVFHKTGKDYSEARVGKGVVLLGNDVNVLLAATAVKREPMADSGLQFIRRWNAEGNYYFITNVSARPVDGWVELGTRAKGVYIMDPLNGHSGTATSRLTDNSLAVYLQLQPGESRILRTLRSVYAWTPKWPLYRRTGSNYPLTGRWNISFLDGGPDLPAAYQSDSTGSWTSSADVRAKSFAGTARYRIAFELPVADAEEWLLDMGDVRESVRIRINDREVGTLICHPYQICIGDFVVPGKNVFEFDVTNLAVNRISDLDKRNIPWKIFYDINFVDINYKAFDASDWPLAPSGLLGPVLLQPLIGLVP